MVTKVTPVPQRRSTRVTNPPQRLREVTPEAENPQAKTAASTTLPNVAEIVQGVGPNSDIMAESPPPSNTLPEPDISDSQRFKVPHHSVADIHLTTTRERYSTIYFLY